MVVEERTWNRAGGLRFKIVPYKPHTIAILRSCGYCFGCGGHFPLRSWKYIYNRKNVSEVSARQIMIRKNSVNTHAVSHIVGQKNNYIISSSLLRFKLKAATFSLLPRTTSISSTTLSNLKNMKCKYKNVQDGWHLHLVLLRLEDRSSLSSILSDETDRGDCCCCCLMALRSDTCVMRTHDVLYTINQ